MHSVFSRQRERYRKSEIELDTETDQEQERAEGRWAESSNNLLSWKTTWNAFPKVVTRALMKQSVLPPAYRIYSCIYAAACQVSFAKESWCIHVYSSLYKVTYVYVHACMYMCVMDTSMLVRMYIILVAGLRETWTSSPPYPILGFFVTCKVRRLGRISILSLVVFVPGSETIRILQKFWNPQIYSTTHIVRIVRSL